MQPISDATETAANLDALQRRLLAKALAVVLSPEWGQKSESDETGGGDD